MPRAYRAMKGEGDPVRPALGDSAAKLGVRPQDLSPDEEGNALPGRGGVSVVSSLAGLRERIEKSRFPPELAPRRLAELGIVPGASGSNSLRVFRIGDGRFERGALTGELMLCPDHHHHGTIQPTAPMPYDAYRQAIAATRDLWSNGEDDA